MYAAEGPQRCRTSVTMPMTSTGALAPTRVARRSIGCRGNKRGCIVQTRRRRFIADSTRAGRERQPAGLFKASNDTPRTVQMHNRTHHELKLDVDLHLSHVLGLLLHYIGRHGWE